MLPIIPGGHRRGEAPANHHRSERAIRINHEWFVSTREGIDVGPYPTRQEAEAAIAELILVLDGVTDPEQARQIVIREFMLVRWTRRHRSANK